MAVKNLLPLARAVLLAVSVSACTSDLSSSNHNELITLVDQGTFSAGGSVIEAKETYDPYHPKPEGMTLHGDHASVFYQIPQNARTLPLVFLHGAGQSMRTWQSTPDGREGLQNIMLKNDYAVYLVDQPRRGDAGRSTVAENITATPDDQLWYGQFRMGLYPKRSPNSQFADGEEALDQFFRQMTPNTGAFDQNVISDAMSAVFDKIGEKGGILVSHSQGGGPGWLTAMKNDKVKAVVSFEPGSNFPFPKGEAPEPMENNGFFGKVAAMEVSMDDFMKLTKIPIIIYYGDFIPTAPTHDPHQDFWRCVLKMAIAFADTVNAHGGNARVVHLPEISIYGNTHFLFSDKNNHEVAANLLAFLHEEGLDRR